MAAGEGHQVSGGGVQMCNLNASFLSSQLIKVPQRLEQPFLPLIGALSCVSGFEKVDCVCCHFLVLIVSRLHTMSSLQFGVGLLSSAATLFSLSALETISSLAASERSKENAVISAQKCEI